jgi:rod shape-determining protein MreC
LSDSLREAFIDAGKAQGLQRSQLVVSGAGLVLDKGTDQGIAAGQKVAHGTAVVGRISKVSQWVGLVQPITAEDFSAAVQIVKLAPQGASYGAKGLLEGTGTGGCRVTAIPYTESVAVGDEVFSADIDGVQGPRLYYGRVVHAEFSAGGEWDVRVEPAFQADTLQDVAVVQQRLNTARTGVARQ